jgi:hypothetical protein
MHSELSVIHKQESNAVIKNGIIQKSGGTQNPSCIHWKLHNYDFLALLLVTDYWDGQKECLFSGSWMQNNKIIKRKIVTESDVQSTANCCKTSLIYSICCGNENASSLKNYLILFSVYLQYSYSGGKFTHSSVRLLIQNIMYSGL